MAKVMLVEDDNNLREIYEARMQAEGYEIVTAKDGEEALVVAKANHPDLIISDVMMPKISGFEMLDILRNTEGLKHVRVIMLTALGQSDDQERADKLGADRYLVKSQVTLEDIVQTAHDLLEDGPQEPAAPLDMPAAPPATVAAAVPLAEPPAVAVAAEPPVMPVAEPPVPAAVTPEPAQTPAVAPTPTPAPTPALAATPAADNTAQTVAQEEAALEEKIEEFVAGAPPEPMITTPAAATPATVSDDQVMSDAVDSLMASTEPTPSLANPVAPGVIETTHDPVKESDGVEIANKKVISPISDGKPDIDKLLAVEEAKQIAAQPAAPVAPLPPATPNSVVSPDPNSIAL